ncbi:MAG: hypothetical protein ABWZ25_19485 [Chitinophagaceae bacterium]
MSSCRKVLTTDITIDFNYEVIDDNYSSPVQISFVNNTSNAQFFRWSFPGEKPSVYDKGDPGIVRFDTAGIIRIKLEAWNDEQHLEKEITIVIDSAVHADFSAEAESNNFSPSDFIVSSRATGATQYKWLFENGTPGTDTGKYPTPVHYDQPGVYRIMLEVSNEREVR